MRFIKTCNSEGELKLCARELNPCDFYDGEELVIQATEGVAIIRQKELTATDIINIIESLVLTARELVKTLADATGYCDGDCHPCPMEKVNREPIHLPDWLMEEAGINADDTLSVYVDEKKRICIEQRDAYMTLGDIPPFVMDIIVNSGIAVCELEGLLEIGVIIDD